MCGSCRAFLVFGSSFRAILGKFTWALGRVISRRVFRVILSLLFRIALRSVVIMGPLDVLTSVTMLGRKGGIGGPLNLETLVLVTKAWLV